MILNPYRYSAAADTGIKAGLVAWYDLEEASGTRSDAHGSLDLTENGTIGSATGKVGDAANKASAGTDSLYHADNASFSITGDMTIAGWINFSSATDNFALVSKWLGTGNQKSYILYKPSGLRTLRFIASADGSASSITLESTARALDTWHFVVVKFVAGGTSTLYIDNASVDTGTAPSIIADTTSRFELFSFNTSSVSSRAGLIDSVGIWNRALDSSELTTLWNSGSGVAYADL